MKKKGRFSTFVLSFVPGLGHIYLGAVTRGAVFLFAEVAVIMFLILGSNLLNSGSLEPLAVFIPVIWLAAMVDSMILVDKINELNILRNMHGESNSDVIKNNEEMQKQNKKIMATVLSVIPGAGHMFLGLPRQGLQLMSLFFMSLFFADFFKISLFLIVIPLIWFFGIFDAMQKSSVQEKLEDNNILPITYFKGNNLWFKNKYKAIGYILVVLGAYSILDQVVIPELGMLLDDRVRNYIQTGIVSALFIFGGVKLIAGSKYTNVSKKGE